MRKLILVLILLGLSMSPALTPDASAFAGCQPSNRLAISFSASGDNTVIASDPVQTIYVWQFFLVNTDATTDTAITLKEGSTSISGAYTLKAAGGNHTAVCTGTPWAVVPSGSAFIINSSAAVALKGTVYYTLNK